MPAARAKKTRTKPEQGFIDLNLFSGARQPFPKDVTLLIRLRDGNIRPKTYSHDGRKGSAFRFRVRFFNNIGDRYTVIVTAKGYEDAGFTPVKVNRDAPAVVDLMLLPKKGKFIFAAWAMLASDFQPIYRFLTCEDATAAEQHYARLAAKRPAVLACLLNLATAMGQVHLRSGTPLAYFMPFLKSYRTWWEGD